MTNRFYEQEWREAMDRLKEQIARLEQLMSQHKTGDPEDSLNAAAKKLAELAAAFPARPKN